jgi:potassium-transporting ATPase KdpC subunit
MTSLGQFGPAARLIVLLTLVLGLGYPLLVTGVGQVAFGSQADGSLVRRDGTVVGSTLIGQVYDDPAYFQGRPSAAGDGYDPLATGASNLGLDNPDLVSLVEERRAAAVKANGTRPDQVAPDALLASGSGLDPQISPEYAAQQVARVARERGLSERRVRGLVEQHTSSRTLGFLGEPRVDLLELNLALDRLA